MMLCSIVAEGSYLCKNVKCMITILQPFLQANSKESDYEKQARLAKFTGASAISSAAYFGREDTNSGELDISASDLVNRLSFQVWCQTSNSVVLAV